MKTLNFYWRLFGTAVGYATFGLGGLLLGMIVIPLLRLVTRDSDRLESWTRNIIRAAFRFYVGFIQALGLFDIQFKNVEALKSDRGSLIVGNHPSLIDIILLIAVTPRPNVVVKRSLYNNFFMKDVLRSAGFVSEGAGSEILPLCGAALARGDNFIIFPEGTRSSPGEPLELKRGAAQLAIRLDAPIRLMHLTLNPTTLTKSEKWYKIPNKKVLFSVKIGDRLSPKTFPDAGAPPSIRARRLTQMLKSHLTP